MKKLNKVMVIGSGPIVIGQGAEFDYSGTQACRVLKEENIEIVLMNSNPATIMTDKIIADIVYSEPLTLDYAIRIIEKEKPDGILIGMGGQTSLNLGIEIHDSGILDKFNVLNLGTKIENIKKSEDRNLFRKIMIEIGQPVIESMAVNTLESAKEVALKIGYPVIVRPAYTLGGSGGGICETEEELLEIGNKGLKYSMTNQVLIEKSVSGWKEIEYEIVRDKKGNTVIVCNMENLDPVGIHTGDSIVVAPSQTLNDLEYQLLRTASIDIANALEIEGGCNVQIALDCNSMDYYVIEVNPRVSRSSSLASKATGYPIAKVATKIALGYDLDEILNDVTKKTYACFEPILDYCVVKIPKWPFDKFDYANKTLGTAMKATGEVMAIGNNFEMALLKAIRSLEINQYNMVYEPAKNMLIDELFKYIKKADPERIFYIAELFRRQVSVGAIRKITNIEEFFLKKILNIIKLEMSIENRLIDFVKVKEIKELKKRGFSDKGISQLLLNADENQIYEYRKLNNIIPVYKMVDTCAGEFEAESPYYYSTYDEYDEVKVSSKKKVLVIGSGPIRIGQGVEFDYCSVHGVLALKDENIESIIINNNPETVSTDFDISDKLYFEPITGEDVMNVIEKEKIDGVILQYGGQTSINLAKFLNDKKVNILGTSFDSLDATEDRSRFNEMLDKHNIKHPKGKGVYSTLEGIKEGKVLGFPLLVRPSYVIGGFGMEIIFNETDLKIYLDKAFKYNNNSVLIDQYLKGKELEVDVLSDGETIYIPGIMEHLEQAGVHSGDSISIYPAVNITDDIKIDIIDTTEKIAKVFNLIGVFNIQYIIYNDKLYIIEVNPRASRTVPMISKVTNIPMIKIATKLMLGKKLKELGITKRMEKGKDFFAIKQPVFSMEKLSNAEMALSPEMKSTGEILSIDYNLNEALYKGFASFNMLLPKSGKILVTISDPYKEESTLIVKELIKCGFKIYTTVGTFNYFTSKGIETNPRAPKYILEDISDNKYSLILSIPTKGRNPNKFGFLIRRASVEYKIPCITSLDTMKCIIDIFSKNVTFDNTKIFNICKIV